MTRIKIVGCCPKLCKTFQAMYTFLIQVKLTHTVFQFISLQKLISILTNVRSTLTVILKMKINETLWQPQTTTI